jgi:hypothetical protein
MGVAMRKPLTLSDEQMQAVRAASASLRLAARDRFLQDLACELARYPHQPSDAELHIAIRSLLRIAPSTHFVSEEEET